METTHATVKVEKLITVTTLNGNVINISEEVLNAINAFFESDISGMLDILNENVLNVSLLQIDLEKEGIGDHYDVEPNFFFYQKLYLRFLKALDKCNKGEK